MLAGRVRLTFDMLMNQSRGKGLSGASIAGTPILDSTEPDSEPKMTPRTDLQMSGVEVLVTGGAQPLEVNDG